MDEDGNKVKRQANSVTVTGKDDTAPHAVTVIKKLPVEENYMAKRMAGYFHGDQDTQEPLPILMV